MTGVDSKEQLKGGKDDLKLFDHLSAESLLLIFF